MNLAVTAGFGSEIAVGIAGRLHWNAVRWVRIVPRGSVGVSARRNSRYEGKYDGGEAYAASANPSRPNTATRKIQIFMIIASQ